MKFLRMVLPLAGTMLVIACGGGIDDDGDGRAGGKDASSGPDGRASDGGKDSGEMSCDQARALIEVFRGQLQECCPACEVPQCEDVSPDICCPITVNRRSPEFERAIDEFKRHCDTACPATTCPSVPSGVCDPDTRTCR
jgi:hypothetical protein